MNREIKEQILQKIKEYDRIMIFRHVRNDGDCVGASKGLKRILQLSFPEKEIYLIDADRSEYLAFMGPEDEPVPEEMYKEALGIVVDTASEARISNKNYKLCKELIKIDHHIPLENYGDLIWVEEDRAAACEMIADFYATFKDELKIDSEAATYIYTGLVTDSGRFKYEGVTGDTMRCAALLLDVGVDTELHSSFDACQGGDHDPVTASCHIRKALAQSFTGKAIHRDAYRRTVFFFRFQYSFNTLCGRINDNISAKGLYFFCDLIG